MLSSIKAKTKGWVAYLIIVLITIPFALFGISEYLTGTSNVVVATIDGEEISKEEFLKQFNSKKRQLQQELGGKYTDEINFQVKFLTVQSMINERILRQLADDSGYVTTQRELQEFIQSSDAFKVQGKFSLDKYKQLLRLNGLSIIEYENLQANELTQEQIKYNFLDSAFATPSALKRLQLLNDQQRKFSYITLNVKDYIDKTKVDPESVKKFFDENKQSFFESPKVKVDFVELSVEKIAKSIKVNDDELFNFYEDEQARFRTEEERKAQHILVESKELANTIVKQLEQGKSFVELASKYSQDTASKDNGGDLGFFTAGVMVPEFETKAFTMEEGEISMPIKTNFGYHIIKLNKIKTVKIKSFDVSV